MEQVTFTGPELGDLILAAQYYAMYLEAKGYFASAAAQYEIAAKAAHGYGFDVQAERFQSYAADCRQRSMVKAA